MVTDYRMPNSAGERSSDLFVTEVRKCKMSDPAYMMWMGGLAFSGGFAILLALMLFWGILKEK